MFVLFWENLVKQNNLKTLRKHSEYMLSRSPQERVGGVGSVLRFRRELPTLKLRFFPPFLFLKQWMPSARVVSSSLHFTTDALRE